jgi:outer membrane lipoprotein SlyB
MLRIRRAGAPAALLAVLALGACAPSSPTRYEASEVGRPLFLDFGTVLSAREVAIEGRNTGIGGAVGAAAGGLAASPIGQGVGRAAAILGGTLLGLGAGALAEQGLSDRVGVEYVITLESGRTVAIVQDLGDATRLARPGERVAIQSSGGYRRVLPADDLPARVARPRGVEVYD